MHRLGLVPIAQSEVNIANGVSQLRLDERLVLQFPADAFSGLVQDLTQHLRVPAPRDRRADTVQHVFEELGGLPTFDGFRLRQFLVGLGLLAQLGLLLFGSDSALAGLLLPVEFARRNAQPDRQRYRHHGRSGESQLVPLNRFLEVVEPARRAGFDRLRAEMPLYVHRQAIGGLVAAGAVLLQTLHHDPVQIASKLVSSLAARWPRWAAVVEFVGSQSLSPGRRAWGFLFADVPRISSKPASHNSLASNGVWPVSNS